MFHGETFRSGRLLFRSKKSKEIVKYFNLNFCFSFIRYQEHFIEKNNTKMSNDIYDLLNRITTNLPNAVNSLDKRNTGNLIGSMKGEMDALIKMLDMHVCIIFIAIYASHQFNWCFESVYVPCIKWNTKQMKSFYCKAHR